MELNEYQKRAMETCMPSSDNFAYMFLNLVGEIGEFSSKVAKMVRKEKAVIYANELHGYFSKEEKEELKKEAGDMLWQFSGLVSDMGWTLEEVAQGNLDKLASRKQRGVIDGEGDNR